MICSFIVNEDDIIHFNEAAVLNAITPITNDYELGLKLGLDHHIISEILKYPIDQQKQKLVSRLFEVKPENCNWTKINAAIDDMKVMEWKVRKSSLVGSSSLESVSGYSSISGGGMYISIINNDSKF